MIISLLHHIRQTIAWCGRMFDKWTLVTSYNPTEAACPMKLNIIRLNRWCMEGKDDLCGNIAQNMIISHFAQRTLLSSSGWAYHLLLYCVNSSSGRFGRWSVNRAEKSMRFDSCLNRQTGQRPSQHAECTFGYQAKRTQYYPSFWKGNWKCVFKWNISSGRARGNPLNGSETAIQMSQDSFPGQASND